MTAAADRADQTTVQVRADKGASTHIPAFIRDKMADMIPPDAPNIGGTQLRWSYTGGRSFVVEIVGYEEPGRKEE